MDEKERFILQGEEKVVSKMTVFSVATSPYFHSVIVQSMLGESMKQGGLCH